MREYFEKLEDQLLEQYAVKSKDSKGRSFPEKSSVTRMGF